MRELWYQLPPELTSLLSAIMNNALRTGMYYLLVATAFFALWLWWRQRPGKRVKLQADPVQPRQFRREFAVSLLAVLVFGTVLPVLFALGFGKHTRFYWTISLYGWPYFFLSIVLMMLIQDTYFYWTHRLMHRRGWFRWFHLTHHRSTNTNPWTTYAIGPLEALLLTGASVITLMLIPTTGLALFIMGWMNTIYGVYGHLGYELYPKGMATHWLGRWFNTSVAHNTHHATGRYNYGYYFLFWDRLMGTVDPDYETRYASAQAGGKQEEGAATQVGTGAHPAH